MDVPVTRTFASRTLSRAGTGALLRALGWAGGYAAWTVAIRLLIVTFVTYFVTSSSGGARPTRFGDISEALGANELSFLGFSALAYVVVVKAANPITSSGYRDFFTPERLEKRFLPGFFHGALVAWGLILAFLISGLFRYLGFAMQTDELPLALPGIVVRTVAVGALAYAEEYLFRQKIAGHLRNFHAGLTGLRPAPLSSIFSTRLGRELSGRFSRHSDAFAAIGAALLYCGVKVLQLDSELGWMTLLSLFLLSLALSLRTLKDGDFARGAGFWAALLVVFHPLLSLPVLGNEFSGLLLVKYVGAGSGNLDPTTRFFTGGAGGPLSSFAFQVLLILDIAQGILRYRRKSQHLITKSQAPVAKST